MSELVERVKRLRLMRRWDQTDVAERIDFSTAIVSQIERGRLKPSEEQVERLARAFGYSPSFLTNEIGLSEASRPLLRAYADASKRESDARIATCVTAVECVRLLGLRPIPDLIPSIGDVDPDDNDALEDAAEELRTAAGVDEGAVVTNMARAAERVGCLVIPFESELGRHIGMSLRTDSVPIICVTNSQSTPGDRQRFTVAHELAHLALHPHRPPPRDSAESKAIERQANRVGAAFLTPADSLLETLTDVGGNVTLNALVEIKSIWGVSVKSLVGRFKSLGIIDSDHARSLYKQISARGWNKKEPVEVPLESAQWLGRSLIARSGASKLKDAAFELAGGIGANAGDLLSFASWEVTPPANVIPLHAAR